MADSYNFTQVGRMLHAAVELIRQNHEWLSQLDGAIGDGDHGATILRAMEAVEKTVNEQQSPDLKKLLSSAGWAVMSCDGGSTGPLLGSFFMGMGDGVAGKNELDLPGMVAMFESGINKMHKQSRAQQGDKTMMDAFFPALAALKAANPEKGIKEALCQAAEAAAAGAEATKSMRAKFGRARNLGDRVIGHPDPGAVSVSLIFKGFCSV